MHISGEQDNARRHGQSGQQKRKTHRWDGDLSLLKKEDVPTWKFRKSLTSSASKNSPFKSSDESELQTVSGIGQKHS